MRMLSRRGDTRSAQSVQHELVFACDGGHGVEVGLHSYGYRFGTWGCRFGTWGCNDGSERRLACRWPKLR